MTIEDVVRVARENERIELTSRSSEKISQSREIVERLIARKEKLY